MKEDKYTKSLAKSQVYAIVHMRDIRKNVLPKFIKLCMETGVTKTKTLENEDLRPKTRLSFRDYEN